MKEKNHHFPHFSNVFHKKILWWCQVNKSPQTDPDWVRTSPDSQQINIKKRREMSIYLGKKVPLFIPSLLHVFWGRELWLKHITAPHPGWAPNKWWWWEGCERHKSRAGEVGEESFLKRLVKIMKTNGDRVSWDGENFICEVSLAGFCCTTASWFIMTMGSRRHAWQRGNWGNEKWEHSF